MPTLQQLKLLILKYEGALEEREVVRAALDGPQPDPAVVELSATMKKPSCAERKTFDVVVSPEMLRECTLARLARVNVEVEHLERLLDIS